MNIDSIINYALGVAGIVVGVLVSIYTYLKAKETKEPKLYYQTYLNIEKIDTNVSNNDIQLFYKSEEVNRVSTTYVWFWNGGKRPIVKSDIPPNSELNILFSSQEGDLKILDFKIVKQSRAPINASVTQIGKSSLKVTFEFLDFKDGFAIEVQHTGGMTAYIDTEGVILGSSDGVKVNTAAFDSYVDPKSSKTDTFFSYIIFALLLIFWCGMTLFVSFYGIGIFFPETVPDFLKSANDTRIVIDQNELVDIIHREAPSIDESSIQAIISSTSELRKMENNKYEKIIFYFACTIVAFFPLLIGFLFWFTRDQPFPRSLKIDRI